VLVNETAAGSRVRRDWQLPVTRREFPFTRPQREAACDTQPRQNALGRLSGSLRALPAGDISIAALAAIKGHLTMETGIFCSLAGEADPTMTVA